MLVLLALNSTLVRSQDAPTPVPQVLVEAIQQANLRSGPGIDYDIVAQITSGTKYLMIGRSAQFPWYLVALPNTNGWVYADLVNGGDTVTLDTSGATGTFASQDVGNGITVTVAGLALGGAQASDYALTQPTTTANITPATLTVSTDGSLCPGSYTGILTLKSANGIRRVAVDAVVATAPEGFDCPSGQ